MNENRGSLTRSNRIACWVPALLLVGSSPAGATASATREPRAETDVAHNDAIQCPYCHGDPERMAAAGIVSHGGFEFGTRDTRGTDELLSETPLLWIETEHFEIGMSVAPYRPRGDELAKLKLELAALQSVLPDAPSKTRVVDPWLRLHLYAQRVDALWERMLEVLQVDDETFPRAEDAWRLGEPYHGEGPHLGQSGKFELLIVEDVETQRRWLSAEFGLRTERTQRWNIGDRQTLTVVINADEERLRTDSALHGHVVFCLAINLLDGYEFYAYETPVWIREGLAHYLERELDPRFNSFSYSEASLAQETRRVNWSTEFKRLVQDGRAPSMAELAHLRTPAEFTLLRHYACWSATAYLIEEHADGYACLNAALHGIRDAQGDADGGAMVDKHREAFETCIGMRYLEFDEAWRDWALEQTPKKRYPGKRFQRSRYESVASTPAR